MKKKLFAILLLACLCLLPQVALADVGYENFPTGGLDLYTSQPTEAQTWQAGDGTVTYTPATATANAKVTFDNAYLNLDSADCILYLAKDMTWDIEVKGQNELLCKKRGIVCPNSTQETGVYISGDENSSLSITTENDRALYLASNNVSINGGTYTFTGFAVINATPTIKNANVSVRNSNNDCFSVVEITIDNSTLTVVDTNTTSSKIYFPTLTLKNSAVASFNATCPIEFRNILEIDSTSEFTLCPGTTLEFSSIPGATGTINNNGTFCNNGVIDVSKCDFSSTSTTNFIKAMKLTGCGTVICTDGEDITHTYTNDGTYVPDITTLDLSTATGDVTFSLGEGHSYSWNDENKILTLKNVYINELTLPNEDVTIIIDGMAVVNTIQYAEYGSSGNYGTSKWTIKGASTDGSDTLYSATIIDFNNGSLYIENLNAELSYLSQTGTPQPFHITNSKVTVYNGIMYYGPFTLENAGEYGLQVKNSQLTVKGGTYGTLYAAIITMDDDSVITLDGAYISNSGQILTGLDGLKPYLPSGYSIGREQLLTDDGTPIPNEYYPAVTILVNATGKPATHVTLKKQSTTSSTNNSSHKYTITATADKGGEISPSGSVKVAKGNDKTFTITANDGYTIADVLVDGKSVGAVSTYTFEDVRTSHTIAASFATTKDIGKDIGASLNKKDHIAYVSGYADGTVCPNANITRAETATMFYRLLTDSRLAEIKTTNHSFTDIPTAAWYAEAVATMANGGYITGYADGTFRGNDNITRAEFVTMLVRFIELEDVDCSFTDVSTAHWAYKYIATATANEWLTGYADGTFRPDNDITRAEAISIINRALERGVQAGGVLTNIKTYPDNNIGDWYYYDVVEATNSHDYTGSRPAENWTKLN